MMWWMTSLSELKWIIDIIVAEASDEEYALALLMLAKYFARISDHCTNIAE